MMFLEKYIDISKKENCKIKTFKAKREFFIKEIEIKSEEEKISKIKLIKEIANENDIKIYDIIEKNFYIYIVIDSDNSNSTTFDQLFTKEKEIIKKEDIIKGSGSYLTLKDVQELYKKGDKKVFKIIADKYIKKYGNGFFLEIKESNIPFKKAFFTCNHVLNKNYFQINDKIEIQNQQKIKNINIKDIEIYTLDNYKKEENNLKKRKIITDKFLDYTCIEIFDEDFEDLFLFELSKKELQKKKDIFILQYPKGEDTLSYSLGQIMKIKDSTIYHSASTNKGSSGSPLINREDFSVLGIHYGAVNNGYNNAHDMKYILDDIKSKILNINKIQIAFQKIKEEYPLSENCNNKYLKKEELFIGKLGIIYRGKNKENENKELLIIEIDLFKFYENMNTKDENTLIKEIKNIINNIKKIKYELYDIFFEENSINFVIEKYEESFDDYFKSKNRELYNDELYYFFTQLKEYVKIFRDSNINLDYISFRNILVKKENDKSVKYQFLFYFNKIILDKEQTSSSPERKNKTKDYSKSDLWDIGILLYYISPKYKGAPEILDECYLFEKETEKKEIIIRGSIVRFGTEFRTELRELIIKLLKYNKDERIEWNNFFNYYNFDYRYYKEYLMFLNLICILVSIPILIYFDKKVFFSVFILILLILHLILFF